MYSRSAPPEVTVGEHVLGPADRQRRDRLDREAAREAAILVGLVELLGGDLRRRRLVHPQLVGEAPGGLGGALHHHVAPDLILVVAQPVREPACEVEFSSSRGVSIEYPQTATAAARWKRSSSSPSRT